MSAGMLLLWVLLLVGIVVVFGWLRLKGPPRGPLAPSVTAIDRSEANAWVGDVHRGQQLPRRWHRWLPAVLFLVAAIGLWLWAAA